MLQYSNFDSVSKDHFKNGTSFKSMMRFIAVVMSFSVASTSCEKDEDKNKADGIITMKTSLSGKVSIRMSGSGTAAINWGDGTENETHILEPYKGLGFENEREYSHTYYSQSARTITIIGKNITHLRCWSKLTELDVSKNTALIILDCDFNQLTKLDVSKNTALTKLSCGTNRLTELDVSKNILLTELWCCDNQLTKLDVSKNSALKKIGCWLNQLTELDVSGNTALTYLSFGYNQLTEFDVSKNIALTYLDCSYNQLTEINVSKNTALTNLYCEDIQLTELDVSKNIMLTILWCGFNQLTELDVSENVVLRRLSCGSNLLTTDALNALFSTLHDNIFTYGWGGWGIEKEISIGSNPGTDNCDPSIAEDKGWTVDKVFS